MKVLITGSLGLVGSEAARFYLERGHEVIGVDNNMRRYFFGEDGCVKENMIHHARYTHYEMDCADAGTLFLIYKPDVIIHAAAQPSHDWAAKNVELDFQVNAISTVKLLESFKNYCPESVFIYVSTNKVYGDMPNKIKYKEQVSRYELKGNRWHGFNENMDIDNCIHSFFGCSKLAADLYAQEYGKNYGLKVGIFRCGCITGRNHAGAELHGFLSYIAKCAKEKRRYQIYGYKGKQVRDNIHAFDLVNAFNHFVESPKSGEVYNMGGSRHCNISVLEALEMFKVDYFYNDQPRKGDHVWYISNVSKFRSHYPDWEYTYDMERIYEDLIST